MTPETPTTSADTSEREQEMHVRVLGCSGGVTRTQSGVSFLVEGRVGLDAGSLASGLSIEEQNGIEAVLVSHSHLDHVNDLGALADTRLQQGGDVLPIHCLDETRAALQQHFFNDVLWPDFAQLPSDDSPTIAYRRVAPEEGFEVAGLRVLAVPVDHSVPSCGFLLGRTQYTLAYSGDTGPTERFWQVVASEPAVRTLITEVSFPNRMEELAGLSGHLTTATFAREIEKLAPRSDLRILVYGLKPSFADEIAAEVRALPFDVELVEPDSTFNA